MARILVINPNSSVPVTASIDEALQPLRFAGGPDIDVVRLEDGPPGIQSQLHVDSVVQPVLTCIRETPADAYVIACYSDPGLNAARELTDKPVLGIAECGILTALTLGARFGVISILQNSIARHMRYVGAMGLMNRHLTGVETLFIPGDPRHEHVSSSLVKEVARFGGDVTGLVFDEVRDALVERLPRP